MESDRQKTFDFKENKVKHSSPNKERSEPLGVTKQAPRATGRGDKLEEAAVMKAPLTNGVASDAPRAKRPAAAAPERSKKKAARESEDSGVAPSVGGMARPPPLGTHVISKRASRTNVKEYSNLEDHAIVAWVSAGARASQVGGNRLWRELQEQFQRLTGHGAIKRQNRPVGPAATRRASIHRSPPRGAASRLPRAPARSHSDDDTDGAPSPKRRSLRVRPLDSSSKESPSKASTSNKDESSKESASKQPAAKEPGGRSPRYSELTRRFAARRRRVPSSPPSRSPSPLLEPPPLEPPTRSRRLFNPNANV